ncbi:MAG: hypothetical protein KatS3mg033_0759 [Thermonema sp.]|nr:MAG: hypothetical protein KatS3mg033_0759 [Thermonema sp.]
MKSISYPPLFMPSAFQGTAFTIQFVSSMIYDGYCYSTMCLWGTLLLVLAGQRALFFYIFYSLIVSIFLAFLSFCSPVRSFSYFGVLQCLSDGLTGHQAVPARCIFAVSGQSSPQSSYCCRCLVYEFLMLPETLAPGQKNCFFFIFIGYSNVPLVVSVAISLLQSRPALVALLSYRSKFGSRFRIIYALNSIRKIFSRTRRLTFLDFLLSFR